MSFFEYIEDLEFNEIKEIYQHGCVSGCATGLIYYSDTTAMYDKYTEEMHEVLNNYCSEVGHLPECVEDALKDGTVAIFKNAVVWLVAEIYANTILNT